MKQDLMKGVIDMHVHTNPDLRLRAYDDFELMEAAIRVGARAALSRNSGYADSSAADPAASIGRGRGRTSGSRRSGG